MSSLRLLTRKCHQTLRSLVITSKCRQDTLKQKLVDRMVDHLNIASVAQTKYDLGGFKVETNEREAVFKQLIAQIDNRYASQTKQMTTDELLQLLGNLLLTFPNRIAQFKTYNLATNLLIGYIDFLNQHELILLLFYISFGKKTIANQFFVNKCLKKFDKVAVEQMTVEDLAIVCNSAFKCSCRVPNIHLQEKTKKTINDCLYLLKDPQLFITFIKTIRHNRWQDENLLMTVSCAILFNKTIECYNFAAICHILAAYSDFLFYEENLINVFVNSAFDKLENDDFKEQGDDVIRNKDLKRFLWSLSNLGYEFASELQNLLLQNVKMRIEKGLFKKEVDVLFDILLYLWMSNCQPNDVISTVLTETNAEYVRGLKSKSKARLNILLTVMQLESPQLYRATNLKTKGSFMFSQESQIESRAALKKVYKALSDIAKKNVVNKFSYSCEIPYLNVVGITGFSKGTYKSVFVEVLDDFTCVKNKENTPNGAMKMKIRILEKMDPALIQLTEDEIEGMTHLELCEYLENEIKMLC